MQKPGSVIMLSDDAYRVIPTDGRPAISQNAKFWLGTARGRWEGDTLVVEVTSLNGKGWFDSTGQFYSENTRMVERWTLVDANTIDYEVTIEDPTIYTRPWKMSFPKRRAGTGPAVRRGVSVASMLAACEQRPVCERVMGNGLLRGQQREPAEHPLARLQVVHRRDASEVTRAAFCRYGPTPGPPRPSRAGGRRLK